MYFCFLGYVFLCTCFVCMDLFRGFIVYYPKKASMDPTSAEFKQDLRQRLTPLQWSVTQEKGTERWVVFCLLTMFIKSYSFFVVARRLFSLLFDSLFFLNISWRFAIESISARVFPLHFLPTHDVRLESNSGFFLVPFRRHIPLCLRDQSVYQQVLQATRQRHLRMHFVRSGSFRLGDQIRLGLGMASFLWRHRSERGQTYQRRLSRYVCVSYRRVLFSSFFLHDAWLICICHLFGERRILRIHTQMNIFMGLSWLKALVSHRGPSLQLQKRFLRISQGLFYFPFLNFGSCSWKLCTVIL